MPYTRLEKLGIEIAWAYDSSKHNEDQMFVYFDDDKKFCFAFIADGVSTSDAGRFAATLIIKHIVDYLNDNIHEIEKCSSSDCYESIIRKAVYQAGDLLVKDSVKLKKYMQLKKLSEDYERLKKVYLQVKAFFEEFQSIIKRIRKRIEFIEPIFSAYNSNPFQLSMSDAEKFKSFVQTLQQEKNNLLSIKEKLTHEKETLCDKSFSFEYAQHIKMQKNEINKFIEIIEKCLKEKSAIFTDYSLKLPDLKTPKEIMGSNYEMINNFWDELTNIFSTLVSGIGESAKETIENLYHKIAKKPNNFVSETTLMVIGIFQINNILKVIFFILGDPQVYTYNTKDGTLTVTYLPSKGPLPSYVSSSEGIVGDVYINTVTLHPDNIIIAVSDGAYILYAHPSGSQGALFVNKLRKYLSKKQSLEGFPEFWIKTLKDVDAFDDDASLVLLRIIK